MIVPLRFFLKVTLMIRSMVLKPGYIAVATIQLHGHSVELAKRELPTAF